jgi:hypothetical protein
VARNLRGTSPVVGCWGAVQIPQSSTWQQRVECCSTSSSTANTAIQYGSADASAQAQICWNLRCMMLTLQETARYAQVNNGLRFHAELGGVIS